MIGSSQSIKSYKLVSAENRDFRPLFTHNFVQHPSISAIYVSIESSGSTDYFSQRD
ncbi:unnamed protein product [Meloidogyne enterolobii]|uniref:Uncharacterized protein n=1 Tax=Meloidogyne enterolobii TaxID=390850 RepID=A0ACB1AFN1_MELEN